MPPKQRPTPPDDDGADNPTPEVTSPPDPLAAATAPPAEAETLAVDEKPAPPPEPVKARFTGPEPVFNPEQGIINPGDTMLVSPEQLADPGTPFEPVEGSDD